MNGPNFITHRLTHLRSRIKHAEQLVGFGIGAMVLASLLRTLQTLPQSRAEALYALAVCVVTCFGWALLGVGMRLTTQAVLMDMESQARARTTQRITPSRRKSIVPMATSANDAEPLHRAVWALARQSKVR